MLLSSIKPNQRIDEMIEVYGISNVRLFITFDDFRIEYMINPKQYKYQGAGGNVYLESVDKKYVDLQKSTGDLDNLIIKGIVDVYCVTPDGYKPIYYVLK